MAARLMSWIEGVKAMADRFIDYPPTKRELHRAAANPDRDHFKHVEVRFAEGIPRMISRDEADMLVHVRRVEYKLRCLILWLAATLVEKAQKSPDFAASFLKTSLTRSPEPVLCDPSGSREPHGNAQATATAQNAGALGDQQHLSILKDNSPEPVPCEPQVHGNNTQDVSDLLWRHELDRRKEMAKTLPIGGFSVTTPVIESARRSRRRRGRKLRADVLRQVDARHLVARLLRLPRILARADQMAERLARKALIQSSEHKGHDPHLDPPLFKGRRRLSHLPGNNPGVALPLEKGELEGDQAVQFSHAVPYTRHTLPSISVSLARKPPPNPLYFEPMQRWLPPDELWESADDDEERGDLTWLHHIAGEALRRIGFSPGEEKGSRLPDLSRFEPPSPPQVRAT